ncbi:sugar-binding domain-containing protein [Niabella aquatica]
MKYSANLLYLLLILLLCSFSREKISLAGEWRFAIDRNNEGVTQRWFLKRLDETIMLPGSMNSNGKGDQPGMHTQWTASIYDSSYFFQPRFERFRQPGNFKVPFWLMPDKHYVGTAWYQKEVVLPAGWENKMIEIFLERVHIKSRVWIDGIEAGTQQNSLVAPHVYVVKGLKPGKHTITVRIDNSIKDTDVGANAHSVSDHTQGNWNGIIGRIALTALPDAHIGNIKVYPDVQQKCARVKVAVVNSGQKLYRGTIRLDAASFNTPLSHIVNPVTANIAVAACDTSWVDVKVPVGDKMQLWSEFTPALYRLTARLGNGRASADEQVTTFGMRAIGVYGRQILVNGQPVFLRGNLNNCEFPLTGFPPMEVEHWEKIFLKMKSYGFNHVRFHSWCPPEAAFTAADRTGFYLQPEGPTWPNHSTSLGEGKFIDGYIYEETNRMEHWYGNHASYAMLAAGNEPRSSKQVPYLTGFINYWKEKDPRRIYTGAAVAMSWPLIPANEYMIKSGARNLNWNDRPPSSDDDYADAIKNFTVPYITHEQGQWCVFPNFKEIKKYTGAYRATNFEIFKADLESQGMGTLADSFMLASGKLQWLCYKYEIERSLRTPGLGGFQLLGLQDFPGQGTALVGVLDAFYEEKGYGNAREFSRFNNRVVPLARFKKFVYTNNELLSVAVELFNYGPYKLNVPVSWQIVTNGHNVIAGGKFDKRIYGTGSLHKAGGINYDLASIKYPAQLTLKVWVEGTAYNNEWDFWVYPSVLPAVPENDIYETDTLDAKAVDILNNGGKVFLQAADKVVKGQEVVQRFLPVFWNTSWFKMRPPHTLGFLADPRHPAFHDFPTAYHSDLQWWEIVNNARVMHLEDFPKGFRPLVQPIDTWFMNRRLALVFEAKVGKGKLMVTSADLNRDLDKRIAARQFRHSLINYMRSDAFNPQQQIDLGVINDIFVSPSKFIFDAYTKDSPDELKPGGQRL